MNALNLSTLKRSCTALLVLLTAVNLANAGADETLGEVTIRGDSILRLTLIKKGGSGTTLESPGKTITLQPGEYRVQHVELEGGYSLDALEGRRQKWFKVTPEEPAELIVGAPLYATVDARRHGGFIQMDHKIVDDAGRLYRRDSQSIQKRPPPPTYTVFKGDEKIDSGSFEYG